MKPLIIIAILISFLVGCKNTSKKNIPEKVFSQTIKFAELNDVINTANKEQVASYYKIKFGEPEDAPYEVVKTYFNKSNKEIARTFYENGKIVRSVIYERNDANNISSITDMDYKTNRKTIAEFDIHANIIKSTKYNSDGIIDSKKIFEYDNYSNKIKETHYNSRGSVISKRIYKYDSLNNLTEEFYYDSTGLRSKTESKYDSKGRKIEETVRRKYDLRPSKVVPGTMMIDKTRIERKFRYNKNNKLISEYIKRFHHDNGSWRKSLLNKLIQYSYDENGRLIQETSKSPYPRNKKQPFRDRREESKYDDNGNLIELSRYTITKEDGETMESKWVRKYNSNGDIIEHRYYGNLGEITSFTKYEYNYFNR